MRGSYWGILARVRCSPARSAQKRSRATLFLHLDIQTPSSSPTSGNYNFFFFNFLNVSFGANFNCVQNYEGCIYFSQSFLSQSIGYLLYHSVYTLRYPDSIIFTYIRKAHWCLSILFFTTKIFMTGICLSSNSTPVCLKAAPVEFNVH